MGATMTNDGQRSSIAGMVERLGRLEPGQLGFLLASPGVGKSALVAELAVERALENQMVLHVAINEPVAHVRRHYDEIFKALESLHRTDHEHVIRAERNRLILSYAARTFTVSHLREHLRPFVELGQFHPSFIVVDEIAPDNVDGCIDELSALAREFQAPLWISVDDRATSGGTKLLQTLRDHCALGLRVRADRGWLELTVLVGPGLDAPASLELARDAALLLNAAPGRVRARECVLYSGGAAGAEAAFGEEAERWGVQEVNFTFEDHLQERARSRKMLSEHELAGGDVSLTYVSQRMHRGYEHQPTIRKILQLIWHMVSRSQQVFVIGEIQDDGTVVGGTGWSVELAKMWHKPLWVFDQRKGKWFTWGGDQWTVGEPTIQFRHFAGSGTRRLNDAGRAAIKDLFERSLGA
jgi:hypothetical protein